MKFTAEFKGVRAGDVYPTEFKPGDECPPDLEDAAKACGAVEVKAAKKVPENKASGGAK